MLIIWLTFAGVVRCRDLTAPANGNVDQPGNTVETVATYTCNDGYTLKGEESRTCRESGQWSGEAPTCVRKWISIDIRLVFINFIGHLQL